LGVESSELLESLTQHHVVTRGETINKNNTVEESRAARDAMAKGNYLCFLNFTKNSIFIFSLKIVESDN
jgi:myosin heavy subunit